MKRLILISLLAMIGVWTVQAQTADSTAVAQADTAVVLGGGGVRRGVEFPEKLRKLIEEEKYKEAEAEYAKFKPTIGDDFLAMCADKDFYWSMSVTFPNKVEYKERYEATTKKLRSTYGKRAEVILLELEELPTSTNQDIIRIYTKVIEADSTYTNAYLERGFAWMNEGKMQEACHDFSKHPDYDKMPWKQQCESLLEQEAIEKAAKAE